jgi:hypothetical protein
MSIAAFLAAVSWRTNYSADVEIDTGLALAGSCSGWQWQIVEHQRLEPRTYPALWTAEIKRLALLKGWEMEAPQRFGFCFIRREGERRLLILTPKHPDDNRPQDFLPFK